MRTGNFCLSGRWQFAAGPMGLEPGYLPLTEPRADWG